MGGIRLGAHTLTGKQHDVSEDDSLRGQQLIAHVACQAQAAAHKGAGGWNDTWVVCSTCGQRYTGAMRLGLARELVRRLEKRAPEDAHRLAARSNLGDALMDAGDLGGAEALLRDVLAIRRLAWGRADPTTRDTAGILADVLDLQGHHAGAVALYREVLAATPAKEQEHQNTLVTKSNLANALSRMDDYAEAKALLRGVQATQERLHGPADARALQTASMLGCVLQDQGKHGEAEALHRPTLAARRRVLGPEHPDTLMTAYNLARCLTHQVQHAEAEELLRGVLAVEQRTKGSGHADTLTTAVQLGTVLGTQGKYAEMEAVYRPTLAARRRVLGPEHPDTLMTAYNLARCLTHQGQHAEAEELLRGVLAVEQRTKGPGHADTLQTASLLSRVQGAASTTQ